MDATMTFKKEADFILEHWDNAEHWYDHEGWCDFITWSADKNRALTITQGDELIALGFFWQLDDPRVDWSDHFPEENPEGRYLYSPLAVIKPEHRGRKIWRKMVKTAFGIIDSPHLKYLGYHKLNRHERLMIMRLEDVFNG